MRIIRKVMHRMRTLVQPRRVAHELDEELSFHLEMQTRWHESQGLDRAAAHALAAREFGGATRFREEVLDTRGLTWAQDITRDVRFALRSYRRAPGFTAVAVLTLALGIGTTTAAFSIIDAVLIRPLPYEKPERIVVLTGRDSLGHDIPSVSVPTFDDWRDESRSFSAIALYSTARRTVLTAGEAAHVETANVSGDFFRALGVQPALGRTLMPDDVARGEPAVVVSHGFWARALGGPRRLPDAPLRIGADAYRIVGVLPPGLEYPAGVDLFVPDAFGAPWRTASRNNINFYAIARLAEGVTIDQARSEMRTIAARVHAAHADDLYGRGVSVTTLQRRMVGPVE